jgi:hypothetical protein
MQREYGIDLAEALWGAAPMPRRRMLSLVKGLTQGARLRDPNGYGWGWQEEFLAVMVELEHALIRTIRMAWSKKGTRDLPALSVPRPYDGDAALTAATKPKPKKKRNATPEEMRMIFAKWSSQ